MKVLVVGAGFAGACYARTLAEGGHDVTVIDRRDHIAGNAFDFVDGNGIRVHKYGPHLFHTNNHKVVDWVRRFGSFTTYVHKVVVSYDGGYLPLPVSRATYEIYYKKLFHDDNDFANFVRGVCQQRESPSNAAEYLYSKVGKDLTDLLFRPYTKKMWGSELEQVDPNVVKRISVNPSYEYRYFPKDEFQLLPTLGYDALFKNIFCHDRIRVCLSTPFCSEIAKDFQHVFTSASIDEFFDFCFGYLPYRSIRFHHSTIDGHLNDEFPTPVVNRSDSGPYTRETRWHMFPGHIIKNTGFKSRTVEEPVDFHMNGLERYYPINDPEGNNVKMYEAYKALADQQAGVSFIGRCGLYQYLDMHQVISQSLTGASRWLQIFGGEKR